MKLVCRRSGGVGVDPMTGEETLPMGLGGGVFLDRHGSLLASVTTSEVEHRHLVDNVFPDVIPVVGELFCAWFVQGAGTLRLGMSARGGLGMGLGGWIS